MSKVVRSVKNVTKGYSGVQVKVRNGMFVPEKKTFLKNTDLCSHK